MIENNYYSVSTVASLAFTVYFAWFCQ